MEAMHPSHRFLLPIRFLPVAAAVTLMFFTIAVAVQQSYRQTANDPQIEMAESAAAAMLTGATASTVTTPQLGDIATSLKPYLIVYDETETPVASDMQLHGTVPKPPSGSFAYTKAHSENRFTWAPEPGVRIAAVMVYQGGTTPGYVLAGRSLRETEQREDALTKIVLGGWLSTMAMCLAALTVTDRLKRRTAP
jgi:hypothetical protein